MREARKASIYQHILPDSTFSSVSPTLSRENDLCFQANSPITSFTEIIHRRDPRSGPFAAAKRDEIRGIIEHGTFRIVMRFEAGKHPNTIPSRSVLALKHTEDGQDIYGTRFVVGGHID